MADDQSQSQAEASAEVAEQATEAANEATEAAEKAEEVVEVVTRPSEDGGKEDKKSSKPVEDTEQSRSISANLEKIIEQIEKLSVLELADLVHALEDKFGVSASAPVAVAGAAPAAAAGGEAAEEKTTFNVVLTASGANKIAVIKAVREIVPTLGLKEAKDLVEGAPKPVLESVNKTTAEEAKTKLTTAGGTVELQ